MANKAILWQYINYGPPAGSGGTNPANNFKLFDGTDGATTTYSGNTPLSSPLRYQMTPPGIFGGDLRQPMVHMNPATNTHYYGGRSEVAAPPASNNPGALGPVVLGHAITGLEARNYIPPDLLPATSLPTIARRTDTVFQDPDTARHIVETAVVASHSPQAAGRYVVARVFHSYFSQNSFFNRQRTQGVAQELVRIDRQTNSLLQFVTLGYTPSITAATSKLYGIYSGIFEYAISPDETKIYALTTGATAANVFMLTISMSDFSLLSANALSSTSFLSPICLSADGTVCYALQANGTIRRFDTTTWASLGDWSTSITWTFGVPTASLVADPDGDVLYAVNSALSSTATGKAWVLSTSSGATLYETTNNAGPYPPLSIFLTPKDVFFPSCIDPTNALWTATKASSDTQVYMTREGATARQTKALIAGVVPYGIGIDNSIGKVLILGQKAGAYKIYRSHEYGKAGTFTEVGVAAFSESTHENLNGDYIADGIFAAIAVEKSTKKLQFRTTKDDGATWSTAADVDTLTTSERYDIKATPSGLKLFNKDFSKVYKTDSVLGAGPWSLLP